MENLSKSSDDQSETILIKEFISKVAKHLEIKIKWKGSGLNEKAYDNNNNLIIYCSKKYFRPAEVDSLLGNSKKAIKKLKWRPKYNINLLIEEMIEEELKILNN